MLKRKWHVVFERYDNNERSLHAVEAVGYSQAITFASDDLRRQLDEDAPLHWEREYEVVSVDSLAPPQGGTR